MKIPNYIKQKMHRLAKIEADAMYLSQEIDNWFIGKGLDIEDLRSGDGHSLEELELGNDITDAFCEKMEAETSKFQDFGECKCCLVCGFSMSADAMDGSQVLVCFNQKGHEHKEMQVDYMYSCGNFSN